MKSYINTYSAAIFTGVFSLGRTIDIEVAILGSLAITASNNNRFPPL